MSVAGAARVIGFLLYAFGSWYLVAKHRRTFAAALWIGASAMGIFIISYIHYLLSVWSHGAIYLPMMRSMLYPFGIAVCLVGTYIAFLPRSRIYCGRCDYELSDLPTSRLVCPECGLARAWRTHGHRCAICKYDLSGQEHDRGTCPECGTLYTRRGAAPIRVLPSEVPLPAPTDDERRARRERFVSERTRHETLDAHSPRVPTRP